MAKYSVAYIDSDNAILIPLYEDIESSEEAIKLAQLAMTDNYYNRYIVAIFPSNDGLKRGTAKYEEAKELGEKYKSDGKYSYLLKPMDNRVKIKVVH